MTMFSIDNGQARKILASEVGLEKELQKLLESNLETILDITFLASEYPTSFGGRIDTLGIDTNGSPVIIEYKRSQNDNVINQGLSYLRWLLDHKADFELLCQSKKLDMKLDWDSPRIICIAESYNKFDLDTVDIVPINVELLRYRIYEGELLHIEPEISQKVKIATTGIIKKSQKKRGKDNALQKNYSIDDRLQQANSQIRNLFLQLRERITSLDENIREEPKKYYLAYKTTTNFADVEIRSKDIKIFLNLKSGTLKDSYGMARDLAKPKPVGHWGNGDYEVKVTTTAELDKAFELVKQSYTFHQ